MGASGARRFQHLIDPENCARCGSCESECETQAITHDERNYAIDFDRCSGCQECLSVCPTGAIDSWITLDAAGGFSVAEQLQWSDLPQAVVPAEQIEELFEPGVAMAHPIHSAAAAVNLFSVHAPARATVLENRRLTRGSDVHHLVLDFGDQNMPLLEGQNIGIITPGRDASGRAHAMRVYSIASARDGERAGSNTTALTVKRISEDNQGNAVYGVCSNYLCDLEAGDRVDVVGPYGQNFLLPDEPGASILMIATGTGIAPMRGMIARNQRLAPDQRAQLTLFYGARSDADMPYFDELQALPENAIDLHTAFSRVPGQPRLYVQDAVLQCGERIAGLLDDPRCHIYLCGVKGMEEGIEFAFAEICAQYGLDWPTVHTRLKTEGRLHVETY